MVPGIQLSNSADTPHSRFVSYAATQGITRIGRVGDESTFMDDLHGPMDEPALRIQGMDLEELAHLQWSKKECQLLRWFDSRIYP